MEHPTQHYLAALLVRLRLPRTHNTWPGLRIIIAAVCYFNGACVRIHLNNRVFLLNLRAAVNLS
jgi:hypothetical protein